jgi:hypothetical protein
MRPRTHEYLRSAVQACGRDLGNDVYELQWSKRRIATHLDVSYRTFQYHLDRSTVVSSTPLRIELVGFNSTDRTPSTVSGPTAPRPANSGNYNPPQLHPGTDPTRDRRVPIDVLGIVQQTIEAAADHPDRTQLLTVAASLLQAWLGVNPDPDLREEVVQTRATPREMLREKAREFPRASTVSKSVSSSLRRTEKDCLSDFSNEPSVREKTRASQPELPDRQQTQNSVLYPLASDLSGHSEPVLREFEVREVTLREVPNTEPPHHPGSTETYQSSQQVLVRPIPAAAPAQPHLSSVEAVTQAISPLVEQCRKLGLPSIDNAGLERLQHHNVDAINSARHYVSGRMRTERVTNPIGLLIYALKNNTIIPTNTSTPRPPAHNGPAARAATQASQALNGSTLSDTEIISYYATHLKTPTPSLMGSRTPSLRVQRALVQEHLAQAHGVRESDERGTL